MRPTGDDSSDGPAELDAVFRVLSNPLRRRILTRLAKRNPRRSDEITVQSLVETPHEREAWYAILRHQHLPRLEHTGFITWDRETGAITTGPRFQEIRPLLTLLEDNQDDLPGDWP